jgi:hypothetical protein
MRPIIDMYVDSRYIAKVHDLISRENVQGVLEKAIFTVRDSDPLFIPLGNGTKNIRFLDPLVYIVHVSERYA